MDKRKNLLSRVKRAVIKVGTNVLTNPRGGLNVKRASALAEDMAAARKRDIEVILVTSGAIGAGVRELKLKERPRTISLKQAVAAVGQSELMHIYNRVFKKRGYVVGQILLTQDDLKERKRYLNARNTIALLLAQGVIPIINENDTISYEEIKFGDNDTLSALVTTLVGADLLIILTDTDGLFTADPDKDKEARLIKEVPQITPRMEFFSDQAAFPGTGGMFTKIKAAKIVTGSGIPMVIANGTKPGVVGEILEGGEIGTFFFPTGVKKPSRKCWIAYSLPLKGKLAVDRGAQEALVKRGKSLLPIGITEAQGDFKIGDAVSIVDEEGKEFARGLSNYTQEEVKKIKGLNTDKIEEVLGYKYADEIIHRDNLVIL